MLRTETRNGQTIPYPVLNRTRYENGIGLCQLTQTSSELNGRAKQIIAVRDRLSNVNADSHSKLLLACQIERIKSTLNGACALH